MSRIENLKNAVGESIKSYENKNITENIFSIKGFSGKQYKLFANRLLAQPIVKNYLEIGVWHGSTSIAALKNNTQKVNYWVIDNFSQFGSPKQEFINNWKNNIGDEPNLIDQDCFQINLQEKNIKNVDVYFYDGDHEEEDHYQALKYYYPAMADSFIFMVDDWCWPKVQIGTFHAIRELNLNVEMHVGFYGNEDADGWWNGCGIFVFKK